MKHDETQIGSIYLNLVSNNTANQNKMLRQTL